MTEERNFVELDDDEVLESGFVGVEIKPKTRVVLFPDRLYEENDNPVDREIISPTFNWLGFCQDEMTHLLRHHAVELSKEFKAELIPGEAVDLFTELSIADNRHDLKIPARAMLRLCLKKVLFYRYQLDFEVDGFPKKYFDNIGRGAAECPSVADQKARNDRLRGTQLKARADLDMRMEIIDLAQMSLLLKMLPEMFRRDGYDELEAEQINDLTVNFLIWTLRNDPAFRPEHCLLIYFTLFRFAGDAEVFAEMEKLSLVKESLQLRRLYEEVEIAVSTRGKVMLENFLAKADLASSRGLEVLMRMDNEDKEMGEYTRLRPKVIIPSGPVENNLRNIDSVLAQHGNFTARNNFIITLLPFIFANTIRFSGGRGTLIDLYHDTVAQALNKVVKFDVRRGFSPTTYFFNWVRQAVTRSAWQDRVVHLPDYLRQVSGEMLQAERESEWVSLDEKAELDTAEFLYSSPRAVDRIQRGLIRMGRAVSIDEPLNDDADADTFGSIMPELASKEFSGRIIDKDLLKKTAAILTKLPRFDAEILARRFGIKEELDEQQQTLEQIGDLVGVSRERIRQIETILLTGLKKGKREAIKGGQGVYQIERYVYQVEDVAEMSAWAKQQGLTGEETEWLIWHFCGNAERLFKPMSVADIVDFMEIADVDEIETKSKMIEHLLKKWGSKIEEGVDADDPTFNFIQVIDRSAAFRKIKGLLDGFGFSREDGDQKEKVKKKSRPNRMEFPIVLNNSEKSLSSGSAGEFLREDDWEEVRFLAEKFNFPREKASLFYKGVGKLVENLDPQLAMVLRWGLVKGETAEQIAGKLGVQLVSVHVMLGTAEIYIQDLIANLLSSNP